MGAPSDRPLITYAQNREDLYLWALLGHRPAGKYVDVGCNHERFHSVTRLFYEQGWSGINIDANGEFEREFRHRARDAFVESGIGATAGQLQFREYPDRDGLSTFDEAIKQQHDASGYPYRDRVVPVRTLDDVLAEYSVTTLDFLKIDVEGMEPQVLHGLNLTTTRPSVIVLEGSRQQDCDAILVPHQYRIEFFDGLNVYYVDANVTDVTINSYADRVLHRGYHTDLEQRLRAQLEVLRNAGPGLSADHIACGGEGSWLRELVHDPAGRVRSWADRLRRPASSRP